MSNDNNADQNSRISNSLSIPSTRSNYYPNENFRGRGGYRGTRGRGRNNYYGRRHNYSNYGRGYNSPYNNNYQSDYANRDFIDSNNFYGLGAAQGPPNNRIRDDYSRYQNSNRRTSNSNVRNIPNNNQENQTIWVADDNGNNNQYTLISPNNYYQNESDMYYILRDNNSEYYIRLAHGKNCFINEKGQKYVLTDVIKKPSKSKNISQDDTISKGKNINKKHQV